MGALDEEAVAKELKGLKLSSAQLLEILKNVRQIATFTGSMYCSNVTPKQLCQYLTDLQPWLAQVTKCLQDAGLCGPGGGVPSDPPPWPPA